MLVRTLAAALAASAGVSAKIAMAEPLYPSPYHFPLKNGFPEPSKEGIKKIAEHAGGALPDGGLPTKVSKTAETTFQLITVNEIFEVAFFTELLKNVTHELPGYKVKDKHYVMRVLRRIRAQEETHALAGNGLLASVKAKTIAPCRYNFPVSNYLDAIALANTFTDIVLSVVPAAQEVFAEDGGQETAIIPLVGSILAQEGEQNGWFRAEQHKAPSAAPFLTGGAAQFAASALKLFIVPGSCSFMPDVPTYPPMSALTSLEPKDMMVMFEVESTDIDASKMSIVYVNGQSIPVTEKISNVKTKGKMTTFEALIPFETNLFAKGLTYALLVKGTGKFDSVTDVAGAGLYGPVFLEID